MTVSASKQVTIPQAMDIAISHHKRGELEEAEKIYKQVIAAVPNQSDAMQLLGLIESKRGNNEKAISFIKQALSFVPNEHVYLSNLGNVYMGMGKYREAEEALQEAISINPNYHESLYNLATVYFRKGMWRESEEFFRRDIKVKPDCVESYCMLANIAMQIGGFPELIPEMLTALKYAPTHPDVLYNLGIAYRDKNELEQAISYLEKSYASRADTVVLDYMMNCKHRICDWSMDHKIRGELIEKVAYQNKGVLSPLTPHLSPVEITPEEQYLIVKRYTDKEVLEKGKTIIESVKFTHNRKRKGKIRIGYVSADVYNHAVMHLISGLFALHDRRKFEVYMYSLRHKDDFYLRRVQNTVDQFVDLRNKNDVEAANIIYNDEIDILIDLNGFTKGARTRIFAMRPAPVQVNYLGFPGTMGADFMDYIIADKFVITPEAAPHFAEKIIYMPHAYQANDREQQIADKIPTRAECGLPEEGFVFCCFNNTFKFEPMTFSVWMKILKRVKNSVLWVLESNNVAVGNLRKEAEKRGVDGNRIIFAKNIDKPEHLARMANAGLFLDTYFYNAHTTASDALWAGLPLITVPGKNFAQRVAGSLLMATNMPELICKDFAEYEEMAVELATNAEKYKAIKKKLWDNRLTCPLFDTNQFARDLEKAFEGII